MFSEKQLHKVARIGNIVKDYFDSHPHKKEVKATDMMQAFIDQGIFFKKGKNGIPISALLQNLEKEQKLCLLKHADAKKCEVSRKWIFLPNA